MQGGGKIEFGFISKVRENTRVISPYFISKELINGARNLYNCLNLPIFHRKIELLYKGNYHDVVILDEEISTCNVAGD